MFYNCEHIFTKVQHFPSLKISQEAFEDTLATVLTSKKFPIKDNEITYKFVVTDKSKIEGLVTLTGSVNQEKTLQKTILSLADLWKPATQNGYDVCSYVSLKLKFIDNKINIEITP